MDFLKWGIVFIFFLLVAVVAVSVNNEEISDFQIEDGLNIFKEEVCVDEFGERKCSEITHVLCNGNTYKVPGPTGFTVYEKIVEKEYVECKNEVLNNKEKPSPFDRINENDIEIYNNKIIINIKNSNWRKFIDSNSMDPLIDQGTTTIEIKPRKNEIKVGDIISYNVDEYDYALVHRVVKIGNDEEGIYFITKGDNYWKEDSKVRFSQIEGIVVGVLY
jgi:hypothetical protein|tara:strand:+ start:280 stop:933 length:654 start_codon:yes stop_codon:yes gene_type:complete